MAHILAECRPSTGVEQVVDARLDVADPFARRLPAPFPEARLVVFFTLVAIVGVGEAGVCLITGIKVAEDGALLEGDRVSRARGRRKLVWWGKLQSPDRGPW